MRTLIALGVLPFVLFPLVCSAVKLECEYTLGDGGKGADFVDTEEDGIKADEDKYTYSSCKSTSDYDCREFTIYRSSGRYEGVLKLPKNPDGWIFWTGKCKPVGKKKF